MAAVCTLVVKSVNFVLIFKKEAGEKGSTINGNKDRSDKSVNQIRSIPFLQVVDNLVLCDFTQ